MLRARDGCVRKETRGSPEVSAYLNCSKNGDTLWSGVGVDTSKGMVKRRKKGKRKARRTAQQPTQFARPLRCSAALAALLKPHCEMGTDARLAVGGALLLTRAAATRVLWRYARARGLQAYTRFGADAVPRSRRV